MPAAAYLPPTSPYLQALERASVRQKYAPGKHNDEDDDDVCWVCGKRTPASQAYCSNACRDADERIEPSVLALDGGSGVQYMYEESSPLLSPAVSAVPALVPSRRSNNNNHNGKAVGGSTVNGAAATATSSTARYSPAVKATTAAAAAAAARNASSSDRSGASSRASGSKNGATSTSAKGDSSSGAKGQGQGQQHLTHSSGVIDSSTANEGLRNTTAASIAQGTTSSRRHSSSRVLSSVIEDRNADAATAANAATASGQQAKRNGGAGGGTNSSAGEGGCSSSSPPSSSATSSPTKTVDDDDQIEEDIENLLLPPPIGSYAKKSPGFDYTYAYGVPPATVVIPKSPPVRQPLPLSTNASTGMRKSTSHQNNNSKLVSPLFSPKSVPSANNRAAPATASANHPSAAASTAANSANSSEVITFRRRNHAPDSINGQQKSSHVHGQSSQSQQPGSGNTTAASSAAASPALLASRRHSSHSSSTFSPLMKAQSTISRTASTAASTASSSPKLRPLTPSTTVSSPSPAASSLSSLLKRTTSRGDSSAQLPPPTNSVYNNRPPSKSEILLRPSIGHHDSSSSSCQHPKTDVEEEAQPNNLRSSWLQRNKIAKTIFALNNPKSSNSKEHGRSTRSSAIEAHPTCNRKGCPVAHAAGHPPSHPLANFFTPLTRRSTEPHSPFASPAIQYYDAPDPFEESFSTDNDRRAIEFAEESRKRRPSLSASITAPAIISPNSSVKPQDYSGFAGFLFALHNQRKAAAGTTPESFASKEEDGSLSTAATAAYDLESSESGYDAQDEDHREARGRGRSSRKLNLLPENMDSGSGKTTSESKTQTLLAQPALLKQKLVNVVRASNDPSGKLPTSVEGAAAADPNSARSGSRPTRFLFGRGNAFKNSLNVSQADTEDEISSVSPALADELIEHSQSPQDREPAPSREGRPRKAAHDTYAVPRLRHNHSTSVGEGSQYIVTLRGGRSSDSSDESGKSDSQSKPASDREDDRGRGRMRSAEGRGGTRYPVVSPFTTLERSQTQPEPSEDAGRGRSRQRGTAAFNRSMSPARSSSRARGRDSPRLRAR